MFSTIVFLLFVWKLLGNKKILNKSSKQLIHLLQHSKNWAFSVVTERKEKHETPLSPFSTADLCISLHLCLREWESFFSGNENVRIRTTIFFPGTETESRKVAIRTLTIMYVSLVATSDQNLSRLLVDLIQVSRAVLRYF